MSDAQKPETRKVLIVSNPRPSLTAALSQPIEEIRQEGESLSETRTLPCPDCGSPVIDDGELCYDSHGMLGGMAEATSASDLQFSCNCDLECDQLDALYEAFEEEWDSVVPCPVHDLGGEPETAMCLCERDPHIAELERIKVRPETSDVLPVLDAMRRSAENAAIEFDSRRPKPIGDEDGLYAQGVIDGTRCFRDLLTEGYRVIREEDFRIALYKALADRLPEEIVDDMEDPGPQSLVGPLHEDIMILMDDGTPVRKEWTEPRLTNTEGQP